MVVKIRSRLNRSGQVHMVDIDAKGGTARRVVAAPTICDRIKRIDEGALIESIHLVEKHGVCSRNVILE
jgi:molybdenum cofactor biosynthesis enzyme